MDKNLAGGPFLPVADTSRHTAPFLTMSEGLQEAVNGPFKNAQQLEDRAKVTEAVGGVREAVGERGGEGPRDEQLQLQASVSLFCHHPVLFK